MHRNRKITLALVPVLALAFAGCGDEEVAYCLDQNDNVVENNYCDHDDDGHGGYGWFFYMGGNHYGHGSHINRASTKGSYVRANNKAALAQRGGFGSTGRSTGGGRTGVSTGRSSGGFGSGG